MPLPRLFLHLPEEKYGDRWLLAVDECHSMIPDLGKAHKCSVTTAAWHCESAGDAIGYIGSCIQVERERSSVGFEPVERNGSILSPTQVQARTFGTEEIGRAHV